MKIAILTCENARKYLDTQILPYFVSVARDFVKHKKELDKEGNYDMAILACYDAGFGTGTNEITDLGDEAKTPVVDLRVLDEVNPRTKVPPEEAKKKVAKVLFEYVLQRRTGNELLGPLIRLFLNKPIVLFNWYAPPE